MLGLKRGNLPGRSEPQFPPRIKGVTIPALTNSYPSLPTMNRLLLIHFPLLWLLYRIIRWRIRISRMRRIMPAAAALSPPYSLLRRFIPQSWQTYHADWQFQDRRTYDNFGTDIVPLICLFGKDTIYVADADAVVEIATNINRFPKDLKLYSLPHTNWRVNRRGSGYLWAKCSYFRWRSLAITSKDHLATFFRTE